MTRFADKEGVNRLDLSKYNSTYFDGYSLIDRRRKNAKSFRHFVMKDGLILGMFQGNRGDRPKIDFIIKFLEPRKKAKLRTPQHMHWVVDLLLKKETHKNDVRKIIKYFYNFYQKAPVFKSVKQRNNYQLRAPSVIRKKYNNLKHSGTYSIEYVAYLIELFTLCEKVSPRKNKMFEELLRILVEYCEGTKDFYQVMNKTKPGYRRA